MSATVEQCLERFANRVASVRLRIAASDAEVLGIKANSAVRDAIAAERSAVYVWVAGSLERFVRESLAEILIEINARSIPRRNIQPSLCAILDAPDFDRLREITGQRMWNERAQLLVRQNESLPAAFSVENLPLDGRSIQPRHLETIWQVFSFPGNIVPSPRHKLALLDLSEMRNKLAHGEIDPISFGRTKPAADMMRAMAAIEDIAEHVTMAGVGYLKGNMFLR